LSVREQIAKDKLDKAKAASAGANSVPATVTAATNAIPAK